MALKLCILGGMEIDGENRTGVFIQGEPADLRGLGQLLGEEVTVLLSAPTMADMQAMTDLITLDGGTLDDYLEANPLPDEWTVRDRFAAAAPDAPTWWVLPKKFCKETHFPGDPDWGRKTQEAESHNTLMRHATWRFHFADAMMEARNG